MRISLLTSRGSSRLLLFTSLLSSAQKILFSLSITVFTCVLFQGRQGGREGEKEGNGDEDLGLEDSSRKDKGLNQKYQG